MSAVFLTGSTGFIGSQVVRCLLKQTDLKINVLVRAESQEQAVLRLKRSWWEQPELCKEIGNRINVLMGDLTKSLFGLDLDSYKHLIQSTSYIIHCAANTTPNLSIDELRQINVNGTANIVAFAKEVHSDHGLSRLSYVSTAYVAGKRNGAIHENELTDSYGFSSIYEKTKFEGEQLVDAAKRELPASIFRPSLVVGDSETGAVKTFNTIYYLLKQYLTGHLRVIPSSSEFSVNIVPVDYVVNSIVNLTLNKEASGFTFHLTSPIEKTPTAKELVSFTRLWAKKNMNLDLPKVIFLPTSAKVIEGLLELRSRIKQSEKKTANAFHTLSPYFGQNQDFQRRNTNNLLGDYVYNWEEFLPRLLEYAVYYSFFHRSERTVYEQILFRLQSEAKPIRYHEIIDGKLVNYDTRKVRNELFQIVAALKAMEITKGDVISIIGNNSYRYLLLDVAAGLIGAVSSPIYVTSPPSEINKILAETKAKLLFIGTQKTLQDLPAIAANVKKISFLNPQSSLQLPNGITNWNIFLEQGKEQKETKMALVDFKDIATIRYTFGSTGNPKGACLENGNLRYIAESLASNFPWKTRTSHASYLSFLPMNHVAEGITAMYSPYFIPAAMDFYFLDNYHDLQNALKISKPSVVFAIPRFYEKLWAAVLANKLGQQFLTSKNLIKKLFLRRILRFGLLRKSGLNKCSQLIVGAACISEELVRNFQDLGLEVYNAYGLSEAPLVAMNRIDSNRPGTVGLPLVGTKLRIDEDGEILVNGPQVMRGYLNKTAEQPLKEGWLATGDIGELSSDGYLKISGRKKNIVVTSYGKKVPAESIEIALKSVEHVTECIVVGDNRPFCCAVLWVEKGHALTSRSKIDSAIAKLNRDLEAPAQIKRFVILEEAASSGNRNIDTLKVKRQDLLKQIEGVIENLYAE